ncbi:MAG: precorrin-6Y C5,15-methyltransferase (decarboxylating) subunit CbiT [Clostridia bacterium]|nr:precorrin-6Y C5,15-methyltransferase (decarboxylating) subunit CbiT [Clostridia bacterium]
MSKWMYITPGIPDEEFIRDEGVPMTKNEIRVLSLSKLRLFPGAVVYDVGAGSGSVAVECKIMAANGRVYAIEKNPRGIDLIQENSKKFGVDIHIIGGTAPQALADLPEADRIFIGGSGGNLRDVLETCDEKLKPGGWLVINSVTLGTGPEAFNILKEKNYTLEAVQVNIAVVSQRGRAALWQARNPVTIIAAGKRG